VSIENTSFIIDTLTLQRDQLLQSLSKAGFKPPEQNLNLKQIADHTQFRVADLMLEAGSKVKRMIRGDAP
jgi:hypothetical protein